MKTSVIEVRDMLAVLSVDGVEKRIGEVTGVESVTVNYAGKSATVRYDETRLDVADIKSAVRQHGYESTASAASAGDGHEGPTAPDVQPATPVPAAPQTPSDAAPDTAAAAPATPVVDGHEGHAAPGTQPPTPAPAGPAPTSAVPKSAPDTTAAPATPMGPGPEDHAAAAAQPAMSADMAHEMGHTGKDLPTMVRDMRNRFWICLIFTVPIFVYAPMGRFFKPPAPPFGLELNLWLFLFGSAAILYPSWPFFVSAWRALRTGTLGMAALVVLSVGTGYLFSVGTTFFFKGGGQFFEAVAVLLVFILLGHWLEMRARGATNFMVIASMPKGRCSRPIRIENRNSTAQL